MKGFETAKGYLDVALAEEDSKDLSTSKHPPGSPLEQELE